MSSEKLAFLADCVADLTKRFDAMVKEDCPAKDAEKVEWLVMYEKNGKEESVSNTHGRIWAKTKDEAVALAKAKIGAAKITFVSAIG